MRGKTFFLYSLSNFQTAVSGSRCARLVSVAKCQRKRSQYVKKPCGAFTSFSITGCRVAFKRRFKCHSICEKAHNQCDFFSLSQVVSIPRPALSHSRRKHLRCLLRHHFDTHWHRPSAGLERDLIAGGRKLRFHLFTSKSSHS